VLRLRVSDMESVLKALAIAGVKVASRDGQYVTLKGAANSQRFAITGRRTICSSRWFSRSPIHNQSRAP